MKVHNKLVRDKIPEIIEADGKKLSVKTLSLTMYIFELERKLIEECYECIYATDVDSFIEEAADMLEVLLTMAKAHGVTIEEIEEARIKKVEERGAFEKRLFLEWVE